MSKRIQLRGEEVDADASSLLEDSVVALFLLPILPTGGLCLLTGGLRFVTQAGMYGFRKSNMNDAVAWHATAQRGKRRKKAFVC